MTKKYGLIGYPLGHSFSRSFFKEKFYSEKIDADYIKFEIASIEEFPKIIASETNLAGLNVTIPYKEQVIPYLDDLDEETKSIGAVNVIKLEKNKGKTKLIGYNSDVIGFTRSIEPLLESFHKRALILGTGGASKAIYHGLRRLKVEATFVSRSPKSENTIRYEDITPELLNDYKVIVNCTPLGMYPKTETCPDIPYEALTPQHLLYDLIYNPDTTLFMKRGQEQGAITKNGLEMLLLQAFAAWEIWNR